MNKIKFPLVVVGSQWGDEGKGKVVDILAKEADYVVRFNGGNNAGHTIVLNGEKFPLSLLPSGVLHGKKLFISQGVVIDPAVLLREIDFFLKRKMKVDLMIDPRVHVVMPYHKMLDAATELWKGKKATGSLKLGIGYCYEDKNNRFGIRVEDLIDPDSLAEKVKMYLPLKKLQITKVFGQPADLYETQIVKEYARYGTLLKKYVGDVSETIQNALNSHAELVSASDFRNRSRNKFGMTKGSKKILFEGAHGTFLDAVFGTYPYTTAVYTISGSVFPYVGIAPQRIYSMGIVKAYTTRVGNGPFPTELLNSTGDEIRKNGNEFGTVSKRPRRCGWLDLVLVRTGARLAGFVYLTLTKLDVLSKVKKIKVCTHYILYNKKIRELPAGMKDFAKCKPVYVELRGWNRDISASKELKNLPQEARKYIKFIEKELQIPFRFVFVGPEREQT